MKRYAEWLLIAAFAVGLTWIFWAPLWQGGGFVGGDIYSYFYPQKAFFAERLQSGEFPLWNNRTGFGYPLVAESQTGALYPFNLVLYSNFELNAAYNISFLLHYVLAFLFTILYCRRVGVGLIPGLLAATVYVYGWFPARCSLEWAIVGGTWFPLAIWCAESFLQTRRWRYLAGLSVVTAVQLFAGHFCLAFVTQLSLVLYTLVRLACRQKNADVSAAALDAVQSTRLKSGALIFGSLGLGFLLAAAQLLPTWELKQNSQRLTVTAEHDPGYGHIPPMYLSQVAASWWFWYSPEVNVDQALGGMKFLALNSRTNKTEAHLYFGLLPLTMIVIGVLAGHRDATKRRLFLVWSAVAVLATVYTTGLLLPLTRHLPGFSFFEGLGRYGMATTLAVAVMSAIVLDGLSVRRNQWAWGLLGLAIISLTVWDLHVVAKRMAVSIMVPSPPVTRLNSSPFKAQLDGEDAHQRIFAPGPNLPNLLGHSSSPVYLGLGPAEYFDPEFRFPNSDDVSDSAMPETFSKSQLQWLRDGGITKVVSFEKRKPADGFSDSQPFVDPFLNRAWGRPNQPLFVQNLSESERVTTSAPGATAEITTYRANQVTIDVDSPLGTDVVLKDLYFVGWNALIDGQPVESSRHNKMFRLVTVPAGQHVVTWNYQPASFRWGCVMTAVAFVVLFVICFYRYSKSTKGQTE